MSHDSAAVKAGEKRLTRKLAPLLAAVARKVARKATSHEKGTDETDEFDDVDWLPVAVAVKEELVLVAEDGTKRALATVGVDDEGILDQANARAVDFATKRSAELVGKKWDGDELIDNPRADMAITDTMRDEIRAAVADAVENGASAADLADTIEELSGFSAERAEMIARTEILRSSNQAHLEAFRASGVVQKKAWSASGDDEVCDDCEECVDDGDLDLDDDFSSGDDAPPGHPACRCVLVASFEEAEESDEDEDDEDEDDEAAAE